MILYIRFILQEMLGPMHVAIYAVLRKGEKGKILQSLATDGYPEEIVRLTDKYGKCAVISFEGNPVIGRNYSEKDPVIREIVTDSEKFMTYSYTNSKGENKFLFARKDIFTPALDILQEYRFVVIAQCLSDRVLQTEEELEENRKRGGGRTMHFMDELPEYKGISDLYFAEEKKIEVYRNTSKDEALNMLKEYFFCLWD